jgi:hypothetical protein
MTSRPLDRIRERLRARRQPPETQPAETPQQAASLPASEGEAPSGGAAGEDYKHLDAEELAAQLEAIRESESFRIGHAIVRTLRGPLMLRRRRPLPRSGGTLRRAIASLRSGEGAPDREPLAIPAGNRLLGPLNEKHSTVMFIAWGLERDELVTLTAEVARLQLMLRDFKPLFVTDSDFWDPFSEHGYWFEYVPPFEEWTRHNDATAWPDYVSERMGSIISTYRPGRVVVYEGGPVGDALRRGVLNSILGRGRPTERAALRPPQRRGAR